MYFKLEENSGKKVSFFKKEKEVKGTRCYFTDKSVFATLSDGIKTGENNGIPLWENDYWDAIFCGKCYNSALALSDKDRIIITEFTIRNKYVKLSKKNYPSIIVYDFIVVNSNNSNNSNDSNEYVQAPADPDDLC